MVITSIYFYFQDYWLFLLASKLRSNCITHTISYDYTLQSSRIKIINKMTKLYKFQISSSSHQTFVILLVAMAFISPSVVEAGDRLLATGGVMQIEGAAGGGLTPWALISGYGTREQVGGTVFYTQAKTTGNFDMNLGGVSVGFNNRVEISYAQQHFGLSDTVRGETIRM